MRQSLVKETLPFPCTSATVLPKTDAFPCGAAEVADMDGQPLRVELPLPPDLASVLSELD